MTFKSNKESTDDGLFINEKDKNPQKKNELKQPEFKGKIESKEYKPTTVQDLNVEKKVVKEEEIEKPQFMGNKKEGNFVDIDTGRDVSLFNFKRLFQYMY